MKDKLRKILMCILLVWPYVYFLGFIGVTEESSTRDGISFLDVYPILTLIIYIVSIINACTYEDENLSYKFSFWSMIFKLVHIPFYCFVFLLGVVSVLSTLFNPVGLIVTPIILVSLVLEDFLLMVTTSVYGIRSVLEAKKRGIVTKGAATALIILSFFFVSDVICSVIIYCKMRKNKKVKKVK